MYRYAQLDETGRVFAVGNHSAKLEAENAVLIPPDFDPWGKRWNGTGWEDCEEELLPAWPDRAQADMDYLKMMAGGVRE